MKLYYILVAAGLLAMSCRSQSTPFDKCRRGKSPIKLSVESCHGGGQPCIITSGKNVTGELDFIAPVDTKVLKPKVTAKVYGLSKDIEVSQKDGCNTLKFGKCPLKSGDKATYFFSAPISKDYSGYSPTIEFSFLDDQDKVIICGKVPVKIK